LNENVTLSVLSLLRMKLAACEGAKPMMFVRGNDQTRSRPSWIGLGQLGFETIDAGG
jgi:hypothetical protein